MSRRWKLAFVTTLTFLRLPLMTLFFAGALLHTSAWRVPWLFAASFSALAASALTDLLDGYFARRLQVVTRMGAHADPLMDKFFYLASLPVLVFAAALRPSGPAHPYVLMVLTLLFLARDQWVTFLRSIGALHAAGGGANWSGKLRTAVNFPMICVAYYFEEAPSAWPAVPAAVVYALEGLALALTIVSLVVYTRQYWPHLRRSADLS
jgi:CDP-diacylglycerol--glycerol-3-phosphate 3-phosphatidyltransferase